VLFGVGSIVYLAMPRVIFDTFMADQRLPISLAFMVIACAHLNLRHDYVRRGFATVLVVLLAVRVFEVQTVWSELSPSTASFRDPSGTSTAALGAVACRSGQRRRCARPRLVHAACIAIIERSALVTTVFTVVGKQILHVRDDYRVRVDTTDGRRRSISCWMSPKTEPADGKLLGQVEFDYDYVYVLFTDAN
jgi:hypothetical protein